MATIRQFGLGLDGKAYADDQIVNDLIWRLSEATSGKAAMACLGEIVAAFDIASISYGHTCSPRSIDGTPTMAVTMTHNFPPDWEESTSDVRWADPYYEACFKPGVAVDWRDVHTDSGLTERQKCFLKCIADYRLTQGITIPLRLHRDSLSFVSFAAPDWDRGFRRLVARKRSLLILLAYNFIAVMNTRFLSELRKRDDAPLSARERECLRWSALGKSIIDVAQILGLSPETVRIHLKNSYAKLDAVNRGHAIAIALDRGIFNLH